MQIESGYIFLNELRFHAFHGVMPQERKVGAEFLVTVRIGYDLTKAMLSDEVEDTLNYAAVYALIAEEMKRPSALLEHVAGRIGKTLFGYDPKILSVDIWLTKVNPPMGADGNGAGVELHLINDKTHG
jgi:dihydroneopterin aldolase